jgi:hypothetical protein
MTLKQNETINSYASKKFLLLNLIVFVVLFIFLTPKVSARLFPSLASHKLGNFLETSKSSQSIDPKKYWEFREFYSPGTFVFEKTGISNNIVRPVLLKSGVSLQNTSNYTPFLTFNSPRLQSVDFITSSNSLDKIVMENTINENNFILNTETEKIYRTDSGQYVMIFLKNYEQMKSANGFFDYRIADKELTQGKYWLNVTVITR